MKKIISLIMTCVFIGTYFTAFAESPTTAAGGKCGDNLTWQLALDGTLTISGTGKMYTYEGEDGAPWFTDTDIPITELVVNDGVESISFCALYHTDIYSVTLPDSVTELGECAFGNCQNLEYAILPDSLETLPGGLFNADIMLKYVHLPKNLKRIESYAFLLCSSLDNVVIPNSTVDLEYGAFSQCASLTNIVVPENMADIADSTFFSASTLKAVSFSPNLKTIGHDAFYQCINVDKFILPDGLESIGESAFSMPDIERDSDTEQIVYIPSTVTQIGKNAVYESIVIYGYKGSKAEEYAKENGNKFVEVTESMYNKDDYYSALNAQDDSVPDNLGEPTYADNTITVISESGSLKVYVGAKEIDCGDAAVFIDENDRTQIPVRAIAEACGAEVSWDDTTKTVLLKNGYRRIKLQIDSPVMTVSTVNYKDETISEDATLMDTSATITNERTYIPLRYVGIALNMRVYWVQK